MGKSLDEKLRNKPRKEYIAFLCPFQEIEDRMNFHAEQGYWYLDAKESRQPWRGGSEPQWLIIMRYRPKEAMTKQGGTKTKPVIPYGGTREQ